MPRSYEKTQRIERTGATLSDIYRAMTEPEPTLDHLIERLYQVEAKLTGTGVRNDAA